ncbi:PAS domain-containing protein [bacterium]|nr:PAS domain-containing protein [bacterium]
MTELDNNTLASLLNALPDGILAVSPQRTVIYANAGIYDTLGLSPEEALDQPLWNILRDHSLLMLLDKTGNESFLTMETNVSYPRKLRLRIKIVPLAEKEGLAGGPAALIIFSDISRESSSARDRERSSKLETMRLLTAGVAHELGNPLNSIIMKADLTSRLVGKLPNSELKEKISRDLDVILSESERLKRIVEDFLQAARPLTFRPAETDLKKICLDCLEVLEPELHQRNIVAQKRLSDVPPALLDSDLWRGAVINVLRNAMEAMPEGGIIFLTLDTKDNELILSVRDNGSGMSEDVAQKIFDPFFTTKQTGTGLGMLQIKRAMEAHGGSVEIKSRLGKGTLITLKAPLKRSATHALNPPQ